MWTACTGWEMLWEEKHLHDKMYSTQMPRLPAFVCVCVCVCVLFCNTKNAKNISSTRTKPPYCHCIVHSLRCSRSFIKDVQHFAELVWGKFKQCTVLLMMFRDMISEGELWLAYRSTAHQGPWNHQLVAITKPTAAYSSISHVRSE